MKNRKDTDRQFKWDIERLYPSIEAWDNDLKKFKQMYPKIVKFKGKLGDPDTLLQAFMFEVEVEKFSEKLGVFIMCKVDENLAESMYKEKMAILTNEEVQYSVLSSFFNAEINTLPEEYLKGLIEDKRFVNYKQDLINYLRLRKHILPEAESRIASVLSSSRGSFSQIFSNFNDADLVFADITDSKGKKLPLILSNITSHLLNRDESVRKGAMTNMRAAYKKMENTIAETYIASVKQDWAYAQIHNYPSVLDSHLYPDSIDRKVYDVLMKNIETSLPRLHKFIGLRKKFLGVKTYNAYDKLLPLTSFNKKIKYDDAYEILFKALAPLGEEYVSLLRRSKEERWVDVYPNKGKKSGAYATGVFRENPYVLLNYSNEMDDVSTLAHELGHALHSYHSDRNNDYNNAQYTIFLAEVASTVNEVLLVKYLYKNAKTREEKIHYLDDYLNSFLSTVFRQAMFSMFEYKAHELMEKNEPISKDVLTQYYSSLNDKFYKIKNINKYLDIEWMRIPHFYRSFYVYKYCIGYVSAVCLANSILNNKKDALKKYLEFLSSGGRYFSVDTLKNAGINLETDEPYKVAFADMEWAISELEKLKSTK